LKPKDEDEKEDNSSIKPDANVKRKGLTPSPYDEPIDLNNPPQTK
jgi:hypothetical protein